MGGGGAGGGAGAAAVYAPSRLNDLLDFVRSEFDQATGEMGMLRAAREEYEAMIQLHANELNAMRSMSYDLERKHHDDKRVLQEENMRLQEETIRLRQQLDQRPPPGSSSMALGGLPPSSASSRPVLPSIMAGGGVGGPPGSSSGVRPGSSGFPPSDYGSSERDRYGPPGGGSQAPSLRDRPIDRDSEHSKRSRDEDERYGGAMTPVGAKGKGYSSKPSPNVSTMSPYFQQPGSRPSSTAPNGGPSRDLATSPRPHPGSDMGGPKENEAFDPDTTGFKKEGSDWLTVYNPNVKRVLDVGLVHTLVHDSVVCCVRFSPDGKVLATGCNRNTTLYDTKTGAKLSILNDDASNNKQDNYIRSACFSPDGRFLATGSEDCIVRIWNLAQKRVAKIFSGHKSEIYSLAFSPDGRRLVSGSGDRSAKMWDMDSGTCLFTLQIDDVTIAENGPVDAGVTSVVLSPDGHYIAAGSLDTVVRLWDAHTGKLLDKLKSHKDSVYSVAFSPDGKYLVSGSLDKTLKIWDMNSFKSLSHKEPGSIAQSGDGGRRLAASLFRVDTTPDGLWIVSGSKDRGVQFWDVKTFKAQFMLQGAKNSVISVAVSPVGGLFSTGSGDHSAKIWTYSSL
ncbi:BQ2448_6769 [Microbotryum intermedium]|uniref:BQ2448_6769 protein n=1 Tax=Microbotryum intermedium TaxID=269621 RepID=A0A238FM34_9BASI|nr:BQ2448_6769 [Microbotryum intermedium]